MRYTHRFSLAAFLGISVFSTLTACSHDYYPFLYRPPLSQGNMMNPAAFAMLKPGMSKAEVANLVGQPVLRTPATPDEWHYVYVRREAGKVVQQEERVLYFSGDKLRSWS